MEELGGASREPSRPADFMLYSRNARSRSPFPEAEQTGKQESGMDHATIEDHQREKRVLIEKMLTEPWRDWTREGERVVILHDVILAELTRRLD